MPKLNKLLFYCICSLLTLNGPKAQEIVFYDNFENYNNEQNLLTLTPTIYTSWSDDVEWYNQINTGQGFDTSNGYASSNNPGNVSLIRFENLELDTSYTFSIATKITNQDTNWRRNHIIKAQSGNVIYGEVEVTSPNENSWNKTEFSFTVVEGAQDITFSIYLYAEANMHIDDIKLQKIAPPDDSIFYIDATNGNDLNNGHTLVSAWKTLEKINSSTFNPGDKILFKTGETFYGKLIVSSSGNLLNPIVFDSYGSLEKPIINGRNFLSCIDASNQEYLKFRNLALRNDASDDTEIPENGADERRYGFLANTGYTGVKRNISLEYMKFYKIYPSIATGTENTPSFKGYAIAFSSFGTGENYYDGILIQNSEITDIGYVGISIAKWIPEGSTLINAYLKNVTVTDNYIHHIGGSGIVYFNVEDFSIEDNLITYTGNNTLDARQHGRGSGFWSVRCTNGLLQNNEFSHARGEADSCGAHIDIENDNIIVQYNLSLDNEGGFAEYMGANTNCIYRYNISINDGWRIKGVNGATQHGKTIWFSNFTGFNDEPRIGSSTNHVYNNTIYTKPGMTSRIVIGESAHDNTVKNNIFYIDGTLIFEEENNNSTSETTGYNNIFDNNLWYGNGTYPNISNEIQFQNIARNEIYNTNPLLINSGGTSKEDYKIDEASPAIDAGLSILNNGGFDYWKNTIPTNMFTDIGSNEYTESNLNTTKLLQQTKLKFYPNPIKDLIYFEYELQKTFSISSMAGKPLVSGFVLKSIDISSLETGVYLLNIDGFKSEIVVKN